MTDERRTSGIPALLRYSGSLDANAWERRHVVGEVPDRWPYGLHRLTEYGIAVEPAAPAPRDGLARALRAAGGYEWRRARVDGPDRTAELEICWDERSGVPAAWRSRRRGAPPVATGVIWLTDRVRRAAAHRRLAGPALRSAHRVWTLSSAQLPVLRDHFGVSERKLAHLLFGIDADFFAPGLAPPTPGLAVSAGNDRHRDHETLVAAIGEVRRKLPDARLELATRQPVEVPEELGVRHPRLSHGQLRGLYQRSQVVVVALRPNLHVSGVTVALEAMACARAVVVTDTPGMRDYFTDGENGLLVPPGDVEALAAAVTELMADPARATELGRAGRRAVEQRFTTAAQARRLAELLA